MDNFVNVVAERVAPVFAACLCVLCVAGTVALIVWLLFALVFYIK